MTNKWTDCPPSVGFLLKISAAQESNWIEKARADDIHRLVVGAVILRKRKVLLLRRRDDDFLGGIHELPSGIVESGETLEQALVREVGEETGLQVLEVEDYLGCFDYSSASGRATRQFNFLVGTSHTSPLSLTEHDGYAWADRENLADLPVTHETRQVIRRALGRG